MNPHTLGCTMHACQKITVQYIWYCLDDFPSAEKEKFILCKKHTYQKPHI
jgi:hypothetical protein